MLVISPVQAGLCSCTVVLVFFLYKTTHHQYIRHRVVVPQNSIGSPLEIMGGREEKKINKYDKLLLAAKVVCLNTFFSHS